MKKGIIIVIAVIVSLMIAAKIGLFSALFMFFLVGIIPGTQIIIPANIMLLMISAVMCAILFYATARDILHMILDHHSEKPKKTATSHLPKQRFSEI